MKKAKNTYINNLFNKILNESLQEKADDIVNKINGKNIEKIMNSPVEEGSEHELDEKEMCEGCGSEMTEGSGGVCEQCSSKMDEEVYEEFNEQYDEVKCDYHKENFGEEDERTIRFCNTKSETTESLSKGQKKLDKNKNGKIDAEDFRMMRNKKKESKEGNYDGQSRVIGVDSDIDDQRIGESKKTKLKLTESELISLIEKIVNEQKKSSNIKKGKSAGESKYNTIHKESGKENEDYIKDVTKKMQDYLKKGSKGDYSMDPKMFPQGNGEIAKMEKAAYVPSEDVRDYIEAFTGAGMENLDYDEIKPNEEWVEKNIVGSSETGNNPEWANAVETPVNKRRNKIRKDNLLAKAKRKAYNKAEQPVVQDKTGEGKVDKIMNQLESTTSKSKDKLNEEFGKMKDLISYNRKTQ